MSSSVLETVLSLGPTSNRIKSEQSFGLRARIYKEGPNTMNNLSNIYVGGDISKNFVDIHLNPIGKELRFENSKAGLNRLKKVLSGYKVKQVVFEASGGYERLFEKELLDAGYNVWIVDPKRIKAFIISEGVKAKTDKIDAKMIALFASSKDRIYDKIKIIPEHEKLRALVQRKNNLKEMVAIEKKRLNHPKQEYCKDEIQSLINFMKDQVRALQKQIDSMIENNQDWKHKYLLLISVPGIGPATAVALIAEMPELGSIRDKQVASLLGVAPFNNESGTYRGKASIRGGRFTIRNVVYMAALSAMRYNQKMKEFYGRLRKAGKKPKVALVAIMRKLIVILNVMIGRGQAWNPAA